MPHYFPATIRARLQGRTVRMTHLAKFDFDMLSSGFAPMYLWNGYRDIESGGQTWIGLRNLGALEGLEETQSNIASTIRASISGVNTEALQLAVSEERAHYIGRMLTVYIQFFGSTDNEWEVLDDPYAICAGLMDGMEISRQQREDGATVRTIAVTAPNIFYARRQPPFGFYTDRDQNKRHPGDRFCEFIPELQNMTLPVPWLAITDRPS